MSIEQLIAENTAALKALTVAIQTSGLAAAEVGGEVKKATRTKKADEKTEETVYWYQPTKSLVYEQAPGMPAPTEGYARVTKEVYEAKKLEAAQKTAEVIAKNNAAGVEPQPTASASSATSTAASDVSTSATQTTADASSATADVPFTAVTEAATKLMKSDKPGHGRDALMGLLKKYLPNDDKATLSKLAPLGRNADILADINALLNPPAAAAEEFDPLA